MVTTKELLLTETNYTDTKRAKLVGNMRMLHAAMGISLEAAEFLEIIHKNIFYDKPGWKSELENELADVIWFVHLACDELGTDINELEEKVFKKLQDRHRGSSK